MSDEYNRQLPLLPPHQRHSEASREAAISMAQATGTLPGTLPGPRIPHSCGASRTTVADGCARPGTARKCDSNRAKWRRISRVGRAAHGLGGV